MIEQGLSFTVIFVPRARMKDERGEERLDLEVAHRVWLGGLRGTDWLHDAVERDFAPWAGQIAIESDRRTVHVGAFGEAATVVVVVLGVSTVDVMRTFGKAFARTVGKASGEAFLDWARHQAQQRRQSLDVPPDFSRWALGDLAHAMTEELANVLDVPRERLQLIKAERSADFVLRARYVDRESGGEYIAEVSRDSVMFRRNGRPRTVGKHDQPD